jgi:GT2 family glycosyltransferase
VDGGVAAVVVTHRRPRLATEAVRALVDREQLSTDDIYLVVNGEGGLSDPALEAAVNVIRLPDNPGPAAGFRAGMAAAFDAGAAWAYLCEDDVTLFEIDAPRIQRVLADVDGDPSIGAVVAYGRDLDRRTGHTTVHHTEGPPGVEDVDAACWGASLVSRRVRDAGVVPSDDYFFGYEDFDFWYQMRRAGLRLVVDRHTSTATARHMSLAGRDAAFDGSRPDDTAEPWRAYYVARNYFLLARRFGSPRWIAAHLAYSVRRLQLAASWEERVATCRGLVAGVFGRKGKNPRFLREVGELT